MAGQPPLLLSFVPDLPQTSPAYLTSPCLVFNKNRRAQQCVERSLRFILIQLTFTKTTGTVRGFVFGLVRPRPTPVAFTSIVPHDETFSNPRYVKVEQNFSKKVAPSRIHDCTVAIGRDIFLVSAYWEAGGGPNRAVEAACPGLEWRGEIAVVQAGRFVTFYKQMKNPSVVNKVVSK